MEDSRYQPQHPVSMSGHMPPQGYMPQPEAGAVVPNDPDRKQEIGDILQQIMNITDQSLDEAQARSAAGWAYLTLILAVVYVYYLV